MKILMILVNAGFLKKSYEEGGVKVKGHSHLYGKYLGSAHLECNLNLSLS